MSLTPTKMQVTEVFKGSTSRKQKGVWVSEKARTKMGQLGCGETEKMAMGKWKITEGNDWKNTENSQDMRVSTQFVLCFIRIAFY